MPNVFNVPPNLPSCPWGGGTKGVKAPSEAGNSVLSFTGSLSTPNPFASRGKEKIAEF